MTTTAGQQAIYQLTSGRFMQAIVTRVISGDTVELGVYADGNPWGDGYTTFEFPFRPFDNVTLGTGVGQWQPGTLLDDRINQIPVFDTSSVLFRADDGAAQSLASNTPRRPNDSRTTYVTVNASFTWNLTAIGTQTGSIVVKNDDQSIPTTVTHTFPFSRGIGVGVTVNDTGTMPLSFGFWVPAGNYYSITTTGSVTFAIRENQL